MGRSIYFKENYLVTAHGYGLTIYNVADFKNIEKISYLELRSDIKDFDITNELAFIVDYNNRICIIDITDVGSPQVVSTYVPSNRPIGIEILDNVMIVRTNDDKTEVVNISDLGNPIKESEFYIPSSFYLGESNGIAYSSENLFTISSSHFYSYDLSDTFNPIMNHDLWIAKRLYDLEISEDYAYLATISSIEIIDISNTSDMKIVNTIITNEIDNLHFSDKYLFANSPQNGIYIYSTEEVNSVNINNVKNNFELYQNYPNPFNPVTTIKYSIPNGSVMLNSFQHLNESEIPEQVRNDNTKVTLVVYDLLGKEVKTLVDKYQQPGNYEVTLDASNLSSGIYYYQFKCGEFVQTQKMVLLK